MANPSKAERAWKWRGIKVGPDTASGCVYQVPCYNLFTSMGKLISLAVIALFATVFLSTARAQYMFPGAGMSGGGGMGSWIGIIVLLVVILPLISSFADDDDDFRYYGSGSGYFY